VSARAHPSRSTGAAPILPLPAPDFDALRWGTALASSRASWELAAFAGRLGEIRGGRNSAALTLAFRLILDAQRRGEPAAWLTRRDRTFYPPDAADAAVDVEALVVVWIADALQGARAADRLVRSGGFGLVILDLGPDVRLPIPVLARLGGLAKKHHAAVLCLTEADRGRAALGSLISIRAEAVRCREEADRYRCRATILKDKRQGPGWGHVEVCRGPDGLH
jgi:recombination protein RecA